MGYSGKLPMYVQSLRAKYMTVKWETGRASAPNEIASVSVSLEGFQFFSKEAFA
jgi:hypothetical protein